MLANRSSMIVAERGSGRMTYAKKKIKPFAEHNLRVTLQCTGNKNNVVLSFLALLVELDIFPKVNLNML